jgi:AraC-like DNA-binding protein
MACSSGMILSCNAGMGKGPAGLCEVNDVREKQKPVSRTPWYIRVMTNGDFSIYLTHSTEDENWQMVCTDAGMTHVPPGSPYPPHPDDHPLHFQSVASGRRLSEYHMVYVSSGSGVFESSIGGFKIEAGTLFMLFPGVWHAYHPVSTTGWTEYWVGFSGPQADALMDNGIIGPDRIFFHLGYQASVVGTFLSVFDHVKKQEPLYQFRACAEILRLLAETFYLERLSAQQSRAGEIVEQAKSFVMDNIGTAFDLDQLATTLHLSHPYLNEVFKAYTGMTPYQYCIHAKINRAKMILSSGQASVKEIAWQVGFDDQYYFSRLFKKKTGYSPSEWMEMQTRRS